MTMDDFPLIVFTSEDSGDPNGYWREVVGTADLRGIALDLGHIAEISRREIRDTVESGGSASLQFAASFVRPRTELQGRLVG